MKHTNLMTYEFGRFHRVYEDADGSLYFRFRGFLYGTFREYCIEEGAEE